MVSPNASNPSPREVSPLGGDSGAGSQQASPTGANNQLGTNNNFNQNPLQHPSQVSSQSVFQIHTQIIELLPQVITLVS